MFSRDVQDDFMKSRDLQCTHKSLHPSNQAQETAMQWVRFSGMYLFILFIISPFPQPPCSSVQKWHLFSQTTRLHPFTFSTDGFFLTPFKVVSGWAWWTSVSAYWKNMDSSTYFPSVTFRLPMPSPPHVLSIKELGHRASKFRINKLSWWNRAD